MIENNPSLDIDFRATMDKLGFYVTTYYQNMYVWKKSFAYYSVTVSVQKNLDYPIGGYKLIVSAQSDSMDCEYNSDFEGYTVCKDTELISKSIDDATASLKSDILDKINDLQKFADSI